MKPLQITITPGVDVADIPAMRDMPIDGYANYIQNDIFFVDHHDVLRATIGEYPIATTSQQVDALISYLESVAEQMKAAGV